MARREKKLEKKRQKRDQKQRDSARSASLGVAEQMKRASKAPVLDCVMAGAQGMYQVLFTRQLANGQVALALFLVDQYCLGVKNAFGGIVSPARRSGFLAGVPATHPVTRLDPPTARRYVEDAIAYGRRYGFEPHRDAVRALPLFGDVDASAATRTFEFGRDGKPFYISGPHDSDATQRRILETLARHAGAGGSHFAINVEATEQGFPIDASSAEGWDEVDDDDDDTDDE